MSLPPYPKYKNSGVAWLGEVPEGWEVKRLKYCLSLLTEKSETGGKKVALENIESWSGKYISTESEFDGEGVDFVAGDILFGKLRPYLAKAYLAEFSGEAVGDFHVMRPHKNVAPRFAQYQILNRDFITLVDGSTFGSKMPRAAWDFVGNMSFCLPPPFDQSAIAAFLDLETAKIDALIAEQEKLITLLAEKRQATISHAVTKGLDPNAPMKDSGVAWLGEVPEGWSCRKLNALTEKIGDGLHGTPIYVDESEYFFINGNNLVNGKIVITESTRSVTEKECYSQAINLTKNSVLLSINGTIGNIALYNGENVMLGKSAAYLNCSNEINRNFLAFFLQSDSCKGYFFNSLTGTTIHNLSLETIRATRIPLPCLIDQSAIVAFLDAETARLDALTAEATRGIALLKERRAALISAAVTGKIDVRSTLQTEAL